MTHGRTSNPLHSLHWLDACRRTVSFRDLLAEGFVTYQSSPSSFPDMDIPYAWHPSIVDVQLLRIGQLVIAAVPGEFTTMAGRRLKDAVKAQAIAQGMPSDTKVCMATRVTIDVFLNFIGSAASSLV